jgi:hypothetical protein
LSDFSDYESSDEETHNRRSRSAPSSSNHFSGRRAYPGGSDLDLATKKGSLDEDPFADPFGDSHGVDDSAGVHANGKQRAW